jgi:Xaa-Pro aminopeptidase
MKERIEKIQSILAEGEGALIRSDANRFYLTGFHSSEGTLVITPKRAVFLVDFRYIEKARAVIRHTEVVLMERLLAQIAEICKEDGVTRLLVETESMNLGMHSRIASALKDIAVPADDSRLDSALSDARAVKTRDELANIIAAQKMTDETFSYIIERMTPGRTEREVALDMEFYMRRLGSEGVSFDFIVVSGKNSSLPHGVPTEKKFEVGDFVTMDFGAVVNGYHSDMTRTVAIGRVDDEQRKVYETVLAAQTAGIEFLRAGVKGSEADRVARDLIYGAGYEGCFGHSLGHSVGIEIHEMPVCSVRCDTPLAAGTVMTVEPGIYLENRFGVRIEDMVYITEDGCENLTASRKDLLIL